MNMKRHRKRTAEQQIELDRAHGTRLDLISRPFPPISQVCRIPGKSWAGILIRGENSLARALGTVGQTTSYRGKYEDADQSLAEWRDFEK